jgi:anti-sigma regulatory factor (Ser/Thr protein kinase)
MRMEGMAKAARSPRVTGISAGESWAQVRLQQTFEISHRPEGVRRARDSVRACMQEWCLPVDHDLVVLLLSEVITNAVAHGAPPATVRLVWDATTITVSVRDAGVGSLPARRATDGESESGRGLGMLAALADRWGVDVGQYAKSVWFQLGRRGQCDEDDCVADPEDASVFDFDDLLVLWQDEVEPV